MVVVPLAFDHFARPIQSVGNEGLNGAHMKYAINFPVAIFAGIAMGCIVGCAPTTHVTETTTTREYDTTTPAVAPVMAPASTTNTTTTTQYDNGTVQRTVTQPGPYALPEQSKSTTVTTDTNNGDVQKRSVTTYTSP
jgi:hypothetical protein